MSGYFRPYIDVAGIHVPEYAGILDHLTGNFKRIFGQDLYLGQDTQDYQMISLFADCLDDAYTSVVDVYNDRNPNFAFGNSLDLAVAINGLIRKQSSHSRVVLKLTGNHGTLIKSGSIAIDATGINWLTLADAQIPEAGFVEVDAACEMAGAVRAPAGSINQIGSPTAGWISVINEADAVVGQDLESDAELRARRAGALQAQAMGIKEALNGALFALDGVTAVWVFENSTGTTDSNGIPAHSIAVIVKGGENQEIAQTIINKKSPGCGLYGSVTEEITKNGEIIAVKFSRPDEVEVLSQITLKWLSPVSDAVKGQIRAAVASKVNEQRIGESLYTGLLWAPIIGCNPDGQTLFTPVSVEVKKDGGTFADGELAAGFNEIFYSNATAEAITIIDT